MIMDLDISGRTRACGLIGDPVEHSVSPAMHNAAFRAMGLDYIYVPFRTRREELAAAIAGMRSLNIRGLNVTIPHKVRVITLLDEVDPLAARIGAVNVVSNEDGRLKGFNTDAGGFLNVLHDHGVEPSGMSVTILGAGGASRAVCFALASLGASLTIINRSPGPVFSLKEQILQFFKVKIETLPWMDDSIAAAVKSCGLLVNATSVGMLPGSDSSPVPRNLLRPGLVVADIVYNPCSTQLLQDSEKAGSSTINGLEMLVWQGALAFEIWTGQRPPLNLMRRAAGAALKKHEK